MNRIERFVFLATAFTSVLLSTVSGSASPIRGTGSNQAQAPSINSVATATIWTGLVVSYRIAASNTPTQFGASGLPNGLSLNQTTGEITGTVLNSAQTTVTLTAANKYGEGTFKLLLIPANSPNRIGTTNNCESGVRPPVAASLNGYKQLAFCDDFDSLNTIDSKETGAAGYNWYVRRPWDELPSSAYSLANSALTLADSVYNSNWGLTSADIKTRNGHSFTFGYFEARINFDPTLGKSGPGWPSFWALSANKAEAGTLDPYAELDFFEAFPQQSPGTYYGVFGGTLHDWRYDTQRGYTDYINPKNVVATGLNWTQWHTVGCLWANAKVTWYLDGNEVMTQQFSNSTEGTPKAANAATGNAAPAGVFTDLETQPMGMLLILGTGPNWPMNVDWVRVWQP